MGSSISREQMSEYLDMVHHKFSEDEITHMHKLFHRAAPNGQMGPPEFRRYIEALHIFRRADQQEQYEQLFRGYDSDSSRIITFKEYLVYHMGIVFSTDELFDIVFLMYDVDKTGSISREEMKRVITNSTRWMGYCDAESRDVEAAIDATIGRIFNVVKPANPQVIQRDELRAVTAKHPDVLEKLKNLA